MIIEFRKETSSCMYLYGIFLMMRKDIFVFFIAALLGRSMGLLPKFLKNFSEILYYIVTLKC